MAKQETYTEETVPDATSGESDLDRLIAERFRAERYPEVSVDGGSPWDRDPFEEDDE